MRIPLVSFFHEMLKYKTLGVITFFLSLSILIVLMPSRYTPAYSSVTIELGYVIEIDYNSTLNYLPKQVKRYFEIGQHVEDRLKKMYPAITFLAHSKPERLKVLAKGRNVNGLENRVMEVARQFVGEHKLKVENLRKVHDIFIRQKKLLMEIWIERQMQFQVLSDGQKMLLDSKTHEQNNLYDFSACQNELEKTITLMVLLSQNIQKELEYENAIFNIVPTKIVDNSLRSGETKMGGNKKNIFKCIVASLAIAVMAMLIFIFFARFSQENL